MRSAFGFALLAAPATSQCEVQGNLKVDCLQFSEDGCTAAGCCWSPVSPNPNNEPWCFDQRAPDVGGQCSDIANHDRADCIRFNQADCEGAGCCWGALSSDPGNLPFCFRKPGMVPANPHYSVRIANTDHDVIEHRCQGDCGGVATNNFVNFQLSASVAVTVKSSHWTSGIGTEWHLRPSHLLTSGAVTDVDDSQMNAGLLSFRVTKPCQFSVELGEEDRLFPNEQGYKDFHNLMLFFNPPESQMPAKKPRIVSSLNSTKSGSGCQSSEQGRSCVLVQGADSCEDWVVDELTDVYFSSSVSRSFGWGDGCGKKPKRIILKSRSRVFLDDDVVVYARILSESDNAVATGVYGYGVLSNERMGGFKDSSIGNVVSLGGQNSEIYGVTVIDSTYRNIEAGPGSKVSWTKSFAWNSETDCINMKGPGGRIHDNFFKSNDDCLKGYQQDTVFTDNVIWHQDVGRALMLSWGNLGEANDVDSKLQYIRTSIIHDHLGFRRVGPRDGVPEAFGYQVSMMYYSTLINAEHSPSNALGTADSPIIIDGLHVESRVGGLLLLSNGYAGLDNKAGWMGRNGCTGNIHLKITNLDLSGVKGFAMPSVAAGCNLDSNYGSVANGDCICTSAQSCGGDHSCGVTLTMDSSSKIGNLKLGDNAKVESALPTETSV